MTASSKARKTAATLAPKIRSRRVGETGSCGTSRAAEDLDTPLGPGLGGEGDPSQRVSPVSARAGYERLKSDPIGEGRVRYPDATGVQQRHARDTMVHRLSAYMTKGRPRIVVTDNLHTMVSIKRGQGVFTFRLHHMFLGAPPRILRALALYAEKHERKSAQVVRAFVDHHERLIRVRAEPRSITCDVEGRYHDLQEIFDEINDLYFEGSVGARITWGPRTRRKPSRESIKLGSYTVEDALIRIHPVLDAQDVPRFFVAWIVYHEMLHEFHDMPVVDGRRVYHTPEFRRAEAQFDRYTEAVLWERMNLHRLLER
ncbi:MAG: hypothetical protein JKY37_17625 [Nannocystaceae bacterium]|nr:hypothetical protein [Nannocystaceae bacterium]